MTSSLPPLRERVDPPARLDPPPAELGLHWRGLELADIPALHVLFHRIEEHDSTPYRTALEETHERYVADWHSEPTNVLGGFDPAGSLVAFAAVALSPTDTHTLRVHIEGGVDPAHRHRGIGTAMLDWELGRARQLLARSDRSVPARLVVHVEEGMPDSVHMLTTRGFQPRRYYTELRRDLALPLPPVVLKRPLEIVPWSAELDEQVRLAHNVAFAEHWVSEPQTAESWAQGRTYFVPEWSFIVLDRTTDRAQVVGYLLSSKYEQDWPSLGWSEGYIDLLGVRPDWRGRGIATALVSQALHAYATSGMQYASLGVDTQEPGEVFGLYSKLEFEPTRGSTMYTIDL
ncbi:GNAT family N-acetyltransferase [Pseudactinotalea terrae]|uniref:GNAT family N-acetyltransferase n=1 Tax=Pseudactinotalea terrae TaxID=1743262 RepID=UPI0012E2C49D|nr:GNAT family N-acetyltransferase [Pseudactinotalea terrae]